ncbi:hypothetical protein [Psychrobacter vallis]|uniref:hypothetical protein n=1 Tax=Psychrobacter vallis TaxID=248451 RepID=UPI001917E1A9|nr:hypothetical protein [Psychrobacter vallis]
MITLSTFQAYLSAIELSPPSTNQAISVHEHELLKLLATLPARTQAQQAEQLEKILTILRTADIDGPQRLKLTAATIDALDQLVATLRQYYIYETGALSAAQLGYVAQTKSLYYLMIMIYDSVIHRKVSLLNSQKKHTLSNNWQRYFKATKSSSTTTLAVAIYQTLLMYQKLLGEDAICYQKPSPYLWAKINHLYSLAHQYQVADTDLSKSIVTQHSNNIHRLYCQICLYSLLNVRAMRRPNILLVQRLLPEWATRIIATIEPETETRVFVDLKSDMLPTYLTANSDINPYEDCHHCLFIELAPMVEYFESRIQVLIEEGSEGVECYLLNKVLMTLSYRYLQSPLTPKAKYPIKKEAVLITGFNNIHYRVSGSQSFTSLIAMQELPDGQRPRYDTVNQKQDSIGIVISETLGSHDALSLFRTLRLPAKSDNLDAIDKEIPQATFNDDEVLKDKACLHRDDLNVVMVDNDAATTEPPPLYNMSLFLICRSDTLTPADWSMGIVRWLNLDAKNPEVEWQVLGHKLVACGLRLEGREVRSRHFVPAFMLGRNEQLGTIGTLIVPNAHFQVNDKVIMRISNKQVPLRLGRRLLITDEFSQYEVVKQSFM